MPSILTALRNQIEAEAKKNPAFKDAREKFLKLCKEVINPYITEADVREMIIQHILTEEIFLTVFDESQFHLSLINFVSDISARI